MERGNNVQRVKYRIWWKPRQDFGHVDAKEALVKTAVGRRFIAFLTIANSGDGERLRQYIAENFADEALASSSVEQCWQSLQTIWGMVGKMRVFQVVATDDYQVMVITQAQTDGSFHMNQMQVQEDRPHKILLYAHHMIILTDESEGEDA